MRHSVQLCVAEPDVAGLPKIEKYPVSFDGIDAIAERLSAYEQPHIALALGGPTQPWRLPDGQPFKVAKYPPDYEEWLRYREAWNNEIDPGEIWLGIHLKLSGSAWLFRIPEPTFEKLPLAGHKLRDARWLLDLLRGGKLRFSYQRGDLRKLAELVSNCDAWAIEESISFIEETSDGYWHGRGRALLSRSLRGCSLGESHRDRFLAAVLGRLESGRFFMHFKDGLRTAMKIDPHATEEAAKRALESEREYVRRYARWVFDRLTERRTVGG